MTRIKASADLARRYPAALPSISLFPSARLRRFTQIQITKLASRLPSPSLGNTHHSLASDFEIPFLGSCFPDSTILSVLRRLHRETDCFSEAAENMHASRVRSPIRDIRGLEDLG